MKRVAAALGLALALGAPGTSSAATLEGAPIRGVTIGPIESALHPGKGYGSEPCARTMRNVAAMGANWVSLTPFGRIANLEPRGIDLAFEAPFADNRAAVIGAARQAHAAGLRVLLVPHLWVEDGGWRALVEPGTDAGWARWAAAYRAFVLAWADVAREADVDLFSVGVEMRSWLTTTRATSFLPIVDEVRRVYAGPLTYSANWDDVDDTVVLGALDVIGINAFYPLTERSGASRRDLRRGGERVAERVRKLALVWNKPVVFTEMGYTTRADPAEKPWEWPDAMKGVVPDEQAQADAYYGLLAPELDEPSFAGFFVWRAYADPDDVSQEAEWGFSPLGKRAEVVLRDAFRARWASEPPALASFLR